jgi:dsRNA-specific ribonuclease
MQEDIRIADGAFEERLGYKFSAKELLKRALTHSSAVPELRAAGGDEAASDLLPRDNERLEFLGDAVLELLTSEYLLANFPEWSEGQLSKSRARIVNAGSLETAARRLRLGEHLRLGRGEEKTGGRDKQTLLADAFEAVLAAVYLDGGLGAAREVLRAVLFDQALEERGERCRNSCKDAGRRRRNIAWPGKAAPTTRRFSRSKSGLMGSAWPPAKAARKRKRNNGRHEAHWNNSHARKRKAEAECRKRQ